MRNIIVNTVKSITSEDSLPFETIVALAVGRGVDPSPYTVMYRHLNEGGSLIAGQSVEVKDGMIFDVARTDRA